MSPAGTAPGQVRPRYGRIAAFSGAVLTTLLTLAAGVGVLPGGTTPAEAASPEKGAMSLTGINGAVDGTTSGPARSGSSAPPPTWTKAARDAAGRTVAPPAASGEGKRVVFDMARQRVWLIDADEQVRRTYPVSGSELDNLSAGDYEVYSRSRQATGIDGSTMSFMVRFTRGENAAIGFHDIPRMNGERVQTRAQLGTPLSHGCVRQARPDAKALWRFAPIGTPVVVTG